MGTVIIVLFMSMFVIAATLTPALLFLSNLNFRKSEIDAKITPDFFTHSFEDGVAHPRKTTSQV